MIDGLISGNLIGAPSERIGQSGRPYVSAKLRAAVAGADAIFVRVTEFSDGARGALLALGDGDSVALSGTLKPTAWVDRAGEARPGADLIAHAVLTAYEVKRRRAAVQEARQPAGRTTNDTERGRQATGDGSGFDDMPDDL